MLQALVKNVFWLISVLWVSVKSTMCLHVRSCFFVLCGLVVPSLSEQGWLCLSELCLMFIGDFTPGPWKLPNKRGWFHPQNFCLILGLLCKQQKGTCQTWQWIQKLSRTKPKSHTCNGKGFSQHFLSAHCHGLHPVMGGNVLSLGFKYAKPW